MTSCQECYWRPQTFLCFLQVTASANVWSLGVVLWEVCEFGKLPYSDLSDDEVIVKVLGEGTLHLKPPSLSCPQGQNLYVTDCTLLFSCFIFILPSLKLNGKKNLTSYWKLKVKSFFLLMYFLLEIKLSNCSVYQLCLLPVLSESCRTVSDTHLYIPQTQFGRKIYDGDKTSWFQSQNCFVNDDMKLILYGWRM